MGIEVMVKKLNGIDSVKVMDRMKKMRASGCKGIAMVPVEDEELKKLIEAEEKKNEEVTKKMNEFIGLSFT